jgi:hypothetical protein
MTYALAKKLGLNLKFSYAMEQELPESNLYLMPSATGQTPFRKDTYELLKQKVANGADLYISASRVFLQGFEDFAGLKVIDSYAYGESKTVNINQEDISVFHPFMKKYVATSARVLTYDNDGNPFITVNKYGKGRVFFVDAPIESNLITVHNAFVGKYEKIYETVFKDHIRSLPVSIDSKDVVFTLHTDEENSYLVAINHSEVEKRLNIDLKDNYKIEGVLYGNEQKIRPYDACVLKLKKR